MQDVEVTLKEKVTSGASSATITITAKTGEDDTTGTIAVKVVKDILSVSEDLTAGTAISYTIGEGGSEDSGDYTTATFLTSIKGGSSTAASAEGFFSGAVSGDLDVTVSDVELQLYKSGTGWTAIDPSVSSTKNEKSNNMMEGPAYLSGQLTTKEDAVANANTEVFGENGWEMGRIKISVTAGTTSVMLKSLSGYFASGKSFTAGYAKVGDNDYVAITAASTLTKSSGTQTGIVAESSLVEQAIPAGESADVYILLGKIAETAPSAGATIEVAELTLNFTEFAILESIEATTTKEEYALNESFDESTVTVKATYDNGKTKTVTGWTTDAETSYDKATVGEQTITVTFTEAGVTKTTELKVTVKDKSLASIAVKTAPTTTAYDVGGTLDLTGLALTLTYDDGSTSSVTYSTDNASDFSTSGFDSTEEKAGTTETVTVTYGGKTTTFDVTINDLVVFTSFVAGTVATENVETAQEFKDSENGTWSVTSAKFQLIDSSNNEVTLNTADYDEDAGTGYSYTGRIKIQKNAVFTIKTKTNMVLRIDGGSPSTNTDRTLAITGADKESWTAATNGSFYLKATGASVTLTADGEFSVYGIHVVSEEVETTLLKTVYSDLAVELSAASCEVNEEVTATATLTKTETYSDGKIVKTTAVDVTDSVAWEGATVSSTGVVTTSSAGNLSITATYTYGDGDNDKLTSTAKALEIASGFVAASKIYALTAGTIDGTEYTATDFGITVTGVTVAETDQKFVTADYTAASGTVPAYITVTSVKKTTSAVTVTVNGTDTSNAAQTATISVEVSASGAITAFVTAYSATKTYTLTPAIIGSVTVATESNWSGPYGTIFHLGGKVTCDGTDLKTGGKLQYKSGGIKFTTTGAATVKITFKTGKADTERHAAYAPITSTTLGTVVGGTTGSTSAAVTETFEIPEAGTYAIGASPSDTFAGSITISEIKVTF